MTVIEIINNARLHLKDPIQTRAAFPDDSSAYFHDTDMIRWLNFAQIELQNIIGQAYENYFMTQTQITIVGGQEQYDMPCGCLQIIRVEDIQNTAAPIEMLPMGFNDKDKYLYRLPLNATAVRNIKFYTIHGNKMTFRPVPNSNITNGIRAWYIKRLEDCSADACGANFIPEIPIQYHELIMWGVVEQGLVQQEANAEAMAAVLGRKNRLLDQLVKTVEDRQCQRSRRVKRKKTYR